MRDYLSRTICKLHIYTLVLLILLIPMPPALAQSSPTHTIQPGETLSQIAELYNIPLEELMELNSITDADAIVSGQILVLPNTSPFCARACGCRG